MSKNIENEEIEFPMIPRPKWGAIIPKWREPMKIPLQYVRFTHTGTESCSTYQTCCQSLQTIQRFYMDDIGLPDIPYNFIIGGDCNVYKGRGWYNEPSRPPSQTWLKGKCVDIAFVGNFRGTQPSERLMEKALELVNYGVKARRIVEHYKLIKIGEDPKSPLDLK